MNPTGNVDLPDGRYSARVQFVDYGYEDHDEPRQVVANFLPCAESASEGGLRSVPAEALDGPVAPEMVLRVELRGGQVRAVSHDWEATVRHAVDAVPDDELVVALREVYAREGDVAANPAIATLDPSKSVLVAGEPGAGKTEFVKSLLHQLETRPDEPVVVFNYKDDYTGFAERMASDRVVRLSTRDSTDVWNVFREVEAEAGFERIGRSLFRDREEHSTEKKFFPITARQALVAAMKYLRREGERCGLAPDNRELLDFFDRFSVAEVYDLLGEHEDLRGEVAAMNPEATKQSVGVAGTLRSVLNDTFVGDFARPDGSFSIREYFDDPAGRVLVLDYPLEEGDRVTDLFRVFLDRSIQCALADGDTRATFVLDEFARIPRVDRMKALVATGRARSVQSIVGVQSVAQLAENYGSDAADSILSGLTQEVFLRAGDERTLSYYTSRLGVEPGRGRPRVGTNATHPTDDPDELWHHLQRLDDGEGYLLKTDGYAHVSVPMLSQLDSETRAAVCRRSGGHAL